MTLLTMLSRLRTNNPKGLGATLTIAQRSREAQTQCSNRGHSWLASRSTLPASANPRQTSLALIRRFQSRGVDPVIQMSGGIGLTGLFQKGIFFRAGPNRGSLVSRFLGE